MSSLALPAVFLGEGKSLIPKPGQIGLFSLGSNLSSGGYTINYTRNPKGNVLIWVNGCCVMKSPIRNLVEVATLSKPMPYPENRVTLDGLLIPVCKSKPFMDDLDNNQFQPNQLHDVADDTVAPNDAENKANHDNNNIVHLMNNREWTNEQKHRIVEIDMLERRRGKNFMRRVKERWDAEYPGIARTAQNLIDNARQFKKERWRRPVEIDNRDEVEVQQQMNNNRTSLEWTTEMKIVLVTLDQEERAKGRGFMKRVKDRWDAKTLSINRRVGRGYVTMLLDSRKIHS